MVRNIQVKKDLVAELCRRHGITKLSLFGSVLRDDFHAESDVDVLVLFEPGCPVGFRIFEIEDQLSRILDGRKVDIINEKFINPRLRDRILADAEVQYAKG